MKLGIYIGSFNPPHAGHEFIVNNLLKQNELDKIIIVPTNEKYSLKKGLESFKHRYNMLKIVFNSDKVIISDLEKNDYNYTYENINLIKKEYPSSKLYLIMGADNLVEFKEWKHYNRIIKACSFIIFKRDNIDIKALINNDFTNYVNKFIIKECSIDISSTLIRKKIKESQSVKEYINENIIKYINENNLYKGE